jgi:hypothetical protein
MKTRAEIEVLTERIVLATMPRQQVDFEGRDAWLIAHPEAATDRKWIADRFRALSRSLRWPETEQRAIRDWLTNVLAEAFGTNDHAGSPSVPSPNPPMPPGPAPGP